MLPSRAVKILFASRVEKPGTWIPLLERALPQDRFTLSVEPGIDVALIAAPPPGTLEALGGARLIQSLWMGVDALLADPALPRHVPLARLVDPGMISAMSETVLAHVLDWHRHHYFYREQQRARRWHRRAQFLASERTVGLLGLGALGSDAAAKLRGLGFGLAGWSRRPKQLAGVQCFSGKEGLVQMLSLTDALVCLLPLTSETRGILDKRAFGAMRQGGCVINVARGAHLVVEDLLAALDSGRLAHAYLDVFAAEPLPADDALWAHPGVTVTPHSAALTEPRTALPKIVDNIERLRRGETPRDLVDLTAGY
jgi:glyoxylate/hydroxypyruvate reductase